MFEDNPDQVNENIQEPEIQLLEFFAKVCYHCCSHFVFLSTQDYESTHVMQNTSANLVVKLERFSFVLTAVAPNWRYVYHPIPKFDESAPY